MGDLSPAARLSTAGYALLFFAIFCAVLMAALGNVYQEDAKDYIGYVLPASGLFALLGLLLSLFGVLKG